MKYFVFLDISGSLEVEADSEEEAKETARRSIRGFDVADWEVTDIWESE